MTLCRMVPAKGWATHLKPFEGDYDHDTLLKFNEQGYHIYFFPNFPSPESYASIPVNPNSPKQRKMPISGEYVDTFHYIFCDMDMKDYNTGTSWSHNYASPEEFIEKLLTMGPEPSIITSSGNGIHAYWRVSDLTAKSFLRLNRRLSTFLRTDPTISTLVRLMRLPNTLNVKDQDNFKLCEIIYENNSLMYDSETIDKFLPPIRLEDEQYCENHYNSTYSLGSQDDISEILPAKFLKLCKENEEVRSRFYEPQKDRSISDFRLGHLIYAAGLSKEEAMIVLSQTSKSTERTKQHRYSYAENIANKIWGMDTDIADNKTSNLRKEEKPFVRLSKTMAEILTKDPEKCEKGIRLKCHELIDATQRGFRLGDVFGLIGGSGNGKSRWCLNMLLWFAERNPEYDHLYVSLEQPTDELGQAWEKMTKNDQQAHIRPFVHILGNYNEDGSYRDLSLDEIQEYAKGLEKDTGRKIGCIIIDHIGVLRQEKRNDEYGGLRGIAKKLKAFAKSTNTFTVIQSQTSRQKNGGGDMELDMDAAFGVSDFENFADSIFCLWQPLRRVYKQAPQMTMTAYKMAKCRHMDVLKDKIKRDAVYVLKFDPETDRLRELTSDEHKAYDYWNGIATKLRNADKKLEPSSVTVIDWIKNA